MKKFLYVIFGLIIGLQMQAQSQGELNEYRRNALATMMVYHSEDTFGIEIHNAFLDMPIPDKYDNHDIGIKVILNDSISGVQKNKVGLIKAQYGKALTAIDVKKNAQALEDLLNKGGCAKELIAKWFNLTGNSIDDLVYNTELVQTRGQYAASDIDVEVALQTARGVQTLADAGEELIGNTFILVNDMTYVTAEEKAAAAKIALNVIGGFMDALFGGNSGRELAQAGAKIADSYTGFTVKTHSYLFQLDWNDSIANVFYNLYYTSTPNPDKIMAFLNNDSTFRVKYVAHEYEFDGKTEMKGKYERAELVKMSCTRSMDKNIASLQLAYEDFKVKTPVYQVLCNDKGKITGYAAKIGLKEGITEMSTFQVVQRIVDPETNRTHYRYVATLKPVKGLIWDNRYNAVTEEAAGSDLTYTTFKKTTGGEILPGMLIIEGRYRKVTE